jgi:hypothetical protein
MSEEEAARTTSFGMLRYAQQYFDGGVATYGLTKHRPSSVALFLMGHSIELALKAFLLAKNVPLSDLRSRDFGHNLEALLAEARLRGIGDVVEITQIDAGVIHLLNIEYSTKRFEYIRTGIMTIPEWHLLEAVARKLAHELQTLCLEAT